MKTFQKHLLDDVIKNNADLPLWYQAEIFREGVRLFDHLNKKHQGIERRKVAIFGGAGYIGTMLTDHLLQQGYAVKCLDLLLYNNERCVLPFLGRPNYEFAFGDMADRDFVAAGLEGVTDVVILAGLVGDPITKKYPEASQIINTDAIRQTIQDLNGKGLAKVIFVSTCSNYGLIEGDVLADELFPLKPLSLYAKAKVEMEQLLLAGQGKVDYCPTVLRFATAFGVSPRMRFDLTVNEFTRDMYLNKDLVVFDAETWRPYCHVRDFSILIQRTLEAPEERISFEVFNAGGEKNNFTKQMIVNAVKAKLPDAPVSYKEHGSDPRNYRVNFSKVRETLLFAPTYSVDDGIAELIHCLDQKFFLNVDAERNFYGNYEIDYPRR